MTREEAKEEKHYISKQEGLVSFSRLDTFIDEIYDDFESRTCSNCKYNGTYNTCLLPELSNRGSGDEYSFDTSDDYYGRGFGCSRFERKD